MADVTHTDLIAQMNEPDRRRLLERSNRAGLLHLLGHSAALVLTGTWIMTGAAGWPFALVVHGFLLIFLFSPLHETIHETAFASRRINRAVAVVCGFFLILPPRWFRAFHFAHHRHTNDPERDPELATQPPATWPEYLWRLTGLPVWREHIAGLVRIAAGTRQDRFVSANARGKIVREARWFLAGYGCLIAVSIFSDSLVLVWLWVLPALLGQPFLRAYLMAEHTLCPHVGNMLENSRTTFTARLMRFIAWNMPYHAEHHSYPSVPFHKLPEFHAMIRSHLGTTSDGYSAFHREMLGVLRGR
ncbi:MAG: fatty acid desaturase [Hyphomicrobiaceae bacterium]